MTISRESLHLIVHAPALTNEDGRPLAVVQAMERALPGLRLAWTISDEGQFIPVSDNARAVRNKTDGRYPLLCNGSEEYLVSISRWEPPASQNPGGMLQL